jgi:large subunit ribosomal protein L23
MQSLLFRRLYATIPHPAAAARTASTPRAVRLRRLRKRPALLPGQSDSTKDGFTPTELARYQRLRAKGKLGGYSGREVSRNEWLEKLNARRSRIRGIINAKKPDAEDVDTQVVGQKIYLPNIIFRLVRNHTPEGQKYNPYEATFRIPQSVTKTDVRSYLSAVYGVKTTYIRTDNYLSPLYRDSNDRSWSQTKSYKTYKRAVVGLVDPFSYPLRLEDMGEKEREEREKWIEERFGIKDMEMKRKYELLRMTKSGSKDWKWRGSLVLKRSAILKSIAERRAAKEVVNEKEAREIRTRRNLLPPSP